MADKGYDVWMGNARGNYYSRNHTTLDPDTDSLFWKFSWHEMGVYDLPAMINLALKVSGAQKLHFVGHSQGVTVFLVMAASNEEYRNKIISMNALAPAVYTSNSEGSITEVLNKYGLLDVSTRIVIDFIHLKKIILIFCMYGIYRLLLHLLDQWKFSPEVFS